MAQTLRRLRVPALVTVAALCFLGVATIGDVWARGSHGDDDEHMIEIARQGSF
jgi:hypothetical protein